MWSFNSPRIVFGEDALESLQDELAERVLIVADKTLKDLGYVDLIKRYLRAAQIQIFDEVEPEPSIQTALRCAQLAKQLDPQLIIAIGGGSVMDVAKIARILMELDLDPIVITPFLKLPELGFKRKSKLIAIPTTSGTGADVTWAAVLTDTTQNIKRTPANKELIPDISILDYRFLQRIPPKLVAGTGMDALAHAIEGLLSPWRNDFSDAMCEKAIQLVLQNLEKSYQGDAEARAKMHHAATMAGLGFGNSQVGLVHSLGHAFGALFKLHHGFCIGLFLPYVLQYYLRSKAKQEMDSLSSKLGLGDAQGLITKIIQLRQSMGIPAKLADLVSREEFLGKLEDLVMNTLSDTSLGTSPRVPDLNQVRRIYEYAFHGWRIDF